MKKCFLIIMTVLMVGILWLGFGVEKVSATSCEGLSTAVYECGDTESGIGSILSNIIKVLSVSVGALGVAGISWAGVQYLTAKDNDLQLNKAKRRIFEVVIGLAAYALAASILQWLLPSIVEPTQLKHYDIPEVEEVVPQSTDEKKAENKKKTYKAQDLVSKKEAGMNYYLNVPKGATSGMALVIFLHGDGYQRNYGGLRDFFISKECRNYNKKNPQFICIIPHTLTIWNDGNVMASLKKIIDKTIKDYEINKKRVYIMGYSRGAIGTWSMVNSYSSTFAAAAPISCPPVGCSASNFKHTKILAISGDRGGDEGRYNSQMQSFVNSIGKNATKKTYYGYSHLTIFKAFNINDVFKWLLKQ